MKKKKLTKLQKAFVEDIRDRRGRTLMSLKVSLKLMRDKLDELEAKVNNEGTRANYSQHSDVMDAAKKIYTQELTLATLMAVETEMIYGNQLKKK